MCKKKENIRQIHKIMIPNNQPGGGVVNEHLKFLNFTKINIILCIRRVILVKTLYCVKWNMIWFLFSKIDTKNVSTLIVIQ